MNAQHVRQTMFSPNNIIMIVRTVLVALALAGCGPGGIGGTPPPATTETGEVVRTAGGAAVNVVAHNHWNDAIAMFERHDGQAGGWTTEHCASTLAKFNEANGAQGGNFTEAIYMMGVVSGRCGNDDQAASYYQQALSTNARYCGAVVGVALTDMRAGRMQPARQRFEAAIAADNQCTAAYVNLAIIQRSNDAEAEEALQNLRRALAIESDYLPAFNQMALLFYDQSERNRQKLDLAEVVCRQAQIINGNYAPIYTTGGLINVRQGNILAALAKFQRAFQLDNRFFEAYMNFGQLTLSYRGYQDASEAFAHAHELRPQSYDALLGLGAALRGLSQFEQAEQRYREAIALDAQRPEAYYNLGLLYQDYMGGQEAQLRQAQGFYRQFAERAAAPRYSETRELVTRTCRRRPETTRRRPRRRGQAPRSEWLAGCTPGRVQQIDENIRLQAELRQFQREMESSSAASSSSSVSSSSRHPRGRRRRRPRHRRRRRPRARHNRPRAETTDHWDSARSRPRGTLSFAFPFRGGAGKVRPRNFLGTCFVPGCRTGVDPTGAAQVGFASPPLWGRAQRQGRVFVDAELNQSEKPS